MLVRVVNKNKIARAQELARVMKAPNDRWALVVNLTGWIRFGWICPPKWAAKWLTADKGGGEWQNSRAIAPREDPDNPANGELLGGCR